MTQWYEQIGQEMVVVYWIDAEHTRWNAYVGILEDVGSIKAVFKGSPRSMLDNGPRDRTIELDRVIGTVSV